MNKQKKKYAFGIVILAMILVGIGTKIYINKITSEKYFRDAIDTAWNNANTGAIPEFLQEIDKLSSYEIVDIEENDGYTIHVIVTGIDLSVELEKINQETYPQNEDALDTYFSELVHRCPQVQTDTVIYAVLSDGEVQIKFSNSFVDAMTGKIYSYYMGKINKIVEEM